MEIAGAVSGSNSVSLASDELTGFAALTADDFMKLLITQLQNQDPTDPVGNDALLSQLSTMRNLASNIELGDLLKALTANQQLVTAAAFIGKLVSGTGTDQETVSGIADRAFLRDGQTFVGVGDAEIPLTDVTDVASAE